MTALLVILGFISLYMVYKIGSIYAKNSDGELTLSSLSNEEWVKLHERDKLGAY